VGLTRRLSARDQRRAGDEHANAAPERLGSSGTALEGGRRRRASLPTMRHVFTVEERDRVRDHVLAMAAADLRVVAGAVDAQELVQHGGNHVSP
jgi:hypothetical protein